MYLRTDTYSCSHTYYFYNKFMEKQMICAQRIYALNQLQFYNKEHIEHIHGLYC